MKKLLLILISILLLSCGPDEKTPEEIYLKKERLRARDRILLISNIDTLTMPDGHIYFFGDGRYWSSMCHAEGYCKNHEE